MPFRLLIADDDPELVQMLQLVLSRVPDLELSVACDGTAALNMALDAPPDLALLDMMMPDLNGIEVCRALKRNERTARVPVIILSAFLAADAQAAATAAGVEDYWHKPLGASELRQRVMARMNGKGHAVATIPPLAGRNA